MEKIRRLVKLCDELVTGTYVDNKVHSYILKVNKKSDCAYESGMLVKGK